MLIEKIQKLSTEEQVEIMTHIDNILSSKKETHPYKPSFDWAGGLSFLKSEFSSVDLQKSAWHQV